MISHQKCRCEVRHLDQNQAETVCHFFAIFRTRPATFPERLERLTHLPGRVRLPGRTGIVHPISFDLLVREAPIARVTPGNRSPIRDLLRSFRGFRGNIMSDSRSAPFCEIPSPVVESS